MTMRTQEYRLILKNNRTLTARFMRLTPSTISFTILGRGDAPVLLSPDAVADQKKHMRKTGWTCILSK